MKYLSIALMTIMLAAAGGSASAQAPSGAAHEKPVLRKPFTLRLQLQDGRHYEERLTHRIPYVYNNAAYLFAGDAFGLKVHIKHNEIVGISYSKKAAGADVELSFRQMKTQSGLAIMMLMIRNKLHKTLYVEAEMTHPQDSNRYQTDIKPIKPGEADYESWAQPIIELKLFKLSFKRQSSY